MKILNKILGKSAWAGENQEVLKGEPLENGNFCTKKFAQISKILETSVNIWTKKCKKIRFEVFLLLIIDINQKIFPVITEKW